MPPSTLQHMTEDDGPERISLLHRGSLDLCVLAVLAQEPSHAYGVVQRLETSGLPNVSYGTVYPLVTRLRRMGCLDQTPAKGDGGPTRNVLSLTPTGHATLRRWASQWSAHHRQVNALLESTFTTEAEQQNV